MNENQDSTEESKINWRLVLGVSIVLLIVGVIAYSIIAAQHSGFPTWETTTNLFGVEIVNSSISTTVGSTTFTFVPFNSIPLTGLQQSWAESYTSTSAYNKSISIRAYELQFDNVQDAGDIYATGILQYLAEKLPRNYSKSTQAYGPANYTLFLIPGEGYQVVGQDGTFVFGFMANGTSLNEAQSFADAMINSM